MSEAIANRVIFYSVVMFALLMAGVFMAARLEELNNEAVDTSSICHHHEAWHSEYYNVSVAATSQCKPVWKVKESGKYDF